MKDAYFIRHDSNATDDPKIVLLIDELGLEGYGIFWVLVETLRTQDNYSYPYKLVKALARRHKTTEKKIQRVICDYDLFIVDKEGCFYSNSLNSRMVKYNDLRKLRANSGAKSGEVRKAIAEQKGNKNEQTANKQGTNVEQTLNKIEQTTNESEAESEAETEAETERKKKDKKKHAARAASPPPLSEEFYFFLEWQHANAPRVGMMKSPLTEMEYHKLVTLFSLGEVKDIFQIMHNWQPLLSKNTSAFLTAKIWLTRDRKNGKTEKGSTHKTFNTTTRNGVRERNYDER